MNKKSLLIISFSLYGGGAERALVNFLNKLPDHLYDVDLLLFRKEGLYLEQLPKWVNLIAPCPAIKGLFWNENSLEPLAGMTDRFYYRGIRPVGTAVGRLLAGGAGNKSKQYRWRYFYNGVVPKLKKHYDAAMSYANGELLCYLADKVSADRKLAWVHNYYPKFQMSAALEKDYFKRMDSVATISEECAAVLRETFPEIREKFMVLPNIVSEAEIRRSAASAVPDDVDPSKPVILSIGRLSRQKRPDLAVEAARLLAERGHTFHWYWLGGPGGEDGRAAELIRQYGLDDTFILAGVRTNPYIYIRQCDVFVQCSEYEGKSVVLDETKILGRPIVATDYPTVHDQLQDDEAVITPITAAGIADGVEKLLTDRELASRLSETLSSRHYGNEEIVRDYITWIG